MSSLWLVGKGIVILCSIVALCATKAHIYPHSNLLRRTFFDTGCELEVLRKTSTDFELKLKVNQINDLELENSTDFVFFNHSSGQSGSYEFHSCLR